MKGLIITLTGPTASGKSTLERMLVERGFAKVISVTTRAPREGEVNGVDYFFVSHEEFEELKANKQLVESVEYQGNFYAVTKGEILRAFAQGKPVVVVVEPSGALQIVSYAREAGWEVLSVYIGGEPHDLIERFIIRSLETGANPRVMTTRILQILRECAEWPEAFTWPVTVDEFSEKSEEEVLTFLTNYARQKMAA